MSFLRQAFRSVCRNHDFRKIPGCSVIVSRDYRGARLYNPEDKIDFEVSKDPEEWKYVSRLLPLKMVPEPSAKADYPSGWQPQSPAAFNGAYYIRRSRNHMVPVYLTVSHRGMARRTKVLHVLGDIWQFASELQRYLEDQLKTSVGYRVDEVGCKVVLRGDYVHLTQQFLLEKGF